MKRKLAAVAAAVVVAVGAGGAATDTNTETLTLEPCKTEDQVKPDCYWDASDRGNGEGADFVVIDGWVYYPGENVTR